MKKSVAVILVVIFYYLFLIVGGLSYAGEVIIDDTNKDVQNFVDWYKKHKSLKHDHQYHPAPTREQINLSKKDGFPRLHKPYFHRHGDYGIHMHGTKYGISKYRNYNYVKHFYWDEWEKVRHCYPNGKYHMDDDNVMTMYSYCKFFDLSPVKKSVGKVCYSFSISDPRDKYYFDNE
jgi:hypothetical protein